MIWIISGPTSAGKSTFISSPRCAELTGLAPGTPVVWPSTVSDLDILASPDALVHYNILRRIELNRISRRFAQSPLENTGDGKLRGFDFDRHRAWMKVAKSPLPKKAIVLVASKETLAQRMDQIRPKENPQLRGDTRNYSFHKWLSLLETVDLAALYREWLQELRNNSIPYVLVDSNNDTYPIIKDEDVLTDIANDRIAVSTNDEHSQAPTTRKESRFT